MKNLPQKIYLNFGDITKEEFEADDYNEFCKIDEYAVTYCEDMVYDTDVEYVRKDVFIEKACDFFEENIKEEDCKIGSSEWTELRAEYKSLDSFIRAFVGYMKGE